MKVPTYSITTFYDATLKKWCVITKKWLDFWNILSQKRDTNFTKLHIYSNNATSPAKNLTTISKPKAVISLLWWVLQEFSWENAYVARTFSQINSGRSHQCKEITASERTPIQNQNFSSKVLLGYFLTKQNQGKNTHKERSFIHSDYQLPIAQRHIPKKYQSDVRTAAVRMSLLIW